MKLGKLICSKLISKECQQVCIYDDYNTRHTGYLDAMLDNGILDDLMCADIYNISARDNTLFIRIFPD